MPRKKRQLDEEGQDTLSKALRVRGATERACHEIWNICHTGSGKPLSRHGFTDHVEDLQPWSEITVPVSFDCLDGSKRCCLLSILRKLSPRFATSLLFFRMSCGEQCLATTTSMQCFTVTNARRATCCQLTNLERQIFSI